MDASININNMRNKLTAVAAAAVVVALALFVFKGLGGEMKYTHAESGLALSVPSGMSVENETLGDRLTAMGYEGRAPQFVVTFTSGEGAAKSGAPYDAFDVALSAQQVEGRMESPPYDSGEWSVEVVGDVTYKSVRRGDSVATFVTQVEDGRLLTVEFRSSTMGLPDDIDTFAPVLESIRVSGPSPVERPAISWYTSDWQSHDVAGVTLGLPSGVQLVERGPVNHIGPSDWVDKEPLAAVDFTANMLEGADVSGYASATDIVPELFSVFVYEGSDIELANAQVLEGDFTYGTRMSMAGHEYAFVMPGGKTVIMRRLDDGILGGDFTSIVAEEFAKQVVQN